MTLAIEAVACQNRLGEGPFWDRRDQVLYWVDINSARLFSLHPESGQMDFAQLPLTVTAMGAREAGGLVVATRSGLGYYDPLDRRLETVLSVLPDDDEGRFNDGRVDPLGRFWAGTYNKNRHPTSKLYRFDPDLTVHTMERHLVNSNGIDWSPDHRTMYHTHTTELTIYAYDFDPSTGETENRRAFIQVPETPGEGRPDGLTVDSEGFLWSARYGGGKIVRYDPEGKFVQEIHLPVRNVTSCEFGGQELNTLFITTAWSGPAYEPGSQEGNLFFVQTAVSGLPKPSFQG